MLRIIREWIRRLLGTLRRGRRDDDLQEELRLHAELAVEAAQHGASDPLEAARGARIRAGGAAQAMDALRDQRGLPWLADLIADVVYVLRMLRRNPLFASVAVVMLAMGIGVTTALFSVFNAVLLRPFPYAAADRLVVVRADGLDGAPQPRLSGAEVDDLRAMSAMFEQVGSVVAVGGNLTSEAGDVEIERVTAANASDEFLPILGVRPHLGRLLDARVDNAPTGVRAVLISHELWQRRYGGDPAILQRPIAVNNRPVAVAGVLPPGVRMFLGRDTNVPPRIDVWFSAGIDGDRRSRGYVAVARLKDGVTVVQARAALSALSRKLTLEHTQAYATRPLRLHVDTLQEDTAREARPVLVALLGTVAIVLLIACANVANLLLARTTARSHEMAMRAAIGARRGRLLRQLLTEGLVLGAIGGSAGLLIARWTGALVMWLRPPALPAVDIALDTRTLVFALAVTVGASILFSLVPAASAARLTLTDALRRSRVAHGSSHRLRTALVTGEVALSVVLLVGAGLMIRTMTALQGVAPGFDADRVLTMQATTQPRALDTLERKLQFYRTGLERLRALPGVTSASAVHPLPLEGVSPTERIAIEGVAAEIPAAYHATFPGYFATMRIPLLAGRDFTPADIEQRRPVAIVDDRFAHAAWPDGRAPGRRIRVLWPGRQSDALEVIGVVAHVRANSLREEGDPQVYLPYHQRPVGDLAIVSRVDGDPMQAARGAREALESLAGSRPVYDIRPLRAYVDDVMAESRFVLILSALFAGLAVTLSAIGTYGVLAYLVAERRREIGIRLALGATRAGVLSWVMRHGLQFTAVGIAIGLAGALAVNQLMASLLFEVQPTDPPTLAMVAGTVTLVAAIACWLPAWRAARLDPTVVLRAE